VAEKLEQGLCADGKGNGEEQASDVKIDEPIRSHDDMK
jgi:hypothetical protein